MPILESLLAAAIPSLLSMGGSALGSWLGSGSSPSSATNRAAQGQEDRISRFTPEQTSALSQLLQQGLGSLGGMKQPSFDPLEERARSQFQTRTIPSIAERFSALGAQNSSGFQEALGQAGSDLESSLAAQRGLFEQQGYGQQLGHLMSLLNTGLTPQFDTLYRPEQPSLFQSALPGLAQGLGQSLPSIVKLLSQFGTSQQPRQVSYQKPQEMLAAQKIMQQRQQGAV